MEHNIFQDHDGIVDHQTHRGSKAAQGHKVKALAGDLQHDESDQQGRGNHQAGHERSAPIAQEEHKDDGREQQSEQNCIAHAGDGFADDCGLIVKRLDVHARRQRGTNLLDLRVDFVGHLQGVAVGLAIYVEQDGGFAIGSHNGVDGCDRGRDFGNVTQPDGNLRRRRLHHNLPNLFGCAHLAADQAKHQFVFVFDESRRVDEVRSANRFQNVADSDSCGQQPRGIWRHLEFRHAAALHDNGSNAVQPVHARFDVVSGDFPELVRRDRV